MSTGSFVVASYERDNGEFRPIRVQPETIAGAWNPPAGTAPDGSLIRVSGGKRRIGVKARTVSLKQNIGAAVNGFQPTREITLPVLTPAAFAALEAIGTEVAYNGGTWQVTGRTAESGR